MTSLSNKPAQPAAIPKRKSEWARPTLTRFAAGDAEQGGGVFEDGYAGFVTVS